MRGALLVLVSVALMLPLATKPADSACCYFAAKDKVHIHDLHATLLALLGLDHEKLTYRHAGRDFRLTDIAGAATTLTSGIAWIGVASVGDGPVLAWTVPALGGVTDTPPGTLALR